MLFVISGTLLAVNCTNKPIKPASVVTEQTTSPHPAQEILINDDRFDKPYILLGQIEYTLKRYTPILVNQRVLRGEAIKYLKKEALVKYGDKVDAIIDTKVQERTEKGHNVPLSITHVQGIAISFKPEEPEEKTFARHGTKRKAKSLKNTFRQSKPSKSTLSRPKSHEIIITPSEILK